MSNPEPFGVVVLSVVKHDYIARAVAAHPRFRLVAVADEDDQPDWVHDRNAKFASEFDVPYVRNVGEAIQKNDSPLLWMNRFHGCQRHLGCGANAA